MTIRAKFYCVSRTETLSPNYNYETKENETRRTYSVRFHPVTGGSEENKRFYASTPGGSIEMHGLTEAVGLQFELSKEYYLDFNLASPPLPATDDRIKRMVDRFLSWQLPENFSPDNGISFKQVIYDGMSPENQAAHWPVGTNLLDCSQAEAMVRHMVEGE
jgi:hypothetical protein